jgi:internalin A
MTKKSDIQIFLAHANEDKPRVLQLYQRLKQAGYKPWLDKKDLLPGQNWRAVIPNAINNSQLFIACLSQQSITKQGYVQKEFKLALSQYAKSLPEAIYLIPLRLDECEIPDWREEEYGVNLRDLHWLDYWKEDGFEKLERAINFQYGPFESEEPKHLESPPYKDILFHSEVGFDIVSIGAKGVEVNQGKSESRPLNEAKLILVGFGAVGKTSLVNRMVHNKFDKDEQKTEGIQITQWPIRLHDREDVRLHIWDFGGQEIMHSTHQFFLTERSLYLLVLNGRQGHEDADAEYWLNLIESFGADSPVIVVLNKIKEHPFDVNRRALQQKYPIREFIATDCEDETGIDELYRTILYETDRLEHLRDAFPDSWFAIKECLAGMKENYLIFERYRQICRENGEGELQAQDSLSGYLHSLGIALNYKDDNRLRDTHVLNPRWVTEGIYAILNSQQLAAQKGELSVEYLTNILDIAQYPPERHSFLLELMRKFELCFRFSEDECRYLIPELLDKQQPLAAEEFNPEECLNFQYHYPILPEGLLPRFIVRSHILSRNLPRWRTGVILEKEGNQALVKADIQERKIIITIKGRTVSRRRLLAIIRSDFERIHSSFKFQVQEMVPVPSHPDVLIPYLELLVMEQNGLRKFPKVIGTQVLELDVQELLNGIDIEKSQRRFDVSRQIEIARRSLNLFYSYSHKDETLREELETHLKLLQRQGLIEQWSDRQITAGSEWEGEIDRNLENANIILLLISSDFIASDYCYDIEMTRALEKHEAGEARVIPVILRDVNWQSSPFGKLQAIPRNGCVWRQSREERDNRWLEVEEEIKAIVEEIGHKYS